MIIGTGVDMVAIDRIRTMLENHEEQFCDRCFTTSEKERAAEINHDRQKIAYYAKRFAAKEAFVKALGTGIREGIGWKDICVMKDELGRPYLSLSDSAQAKLKSITNEGKNVQIHLSLSDEREMALAWVIIEETNE